ncbi:hypothetical protein BKA69DRAFT_1038487 [Paraphysoderma sedebokerense]|nr:hypothetical protein BKA69DRAFT_1038487 [Paraphysoderma sedebokerense]
MSVMPWVLMGSTLVITTGMCLVYSRQLIQTIGSSSSNSRKNIRFLRQLAAVSFILMLADISSLTENYFFFEKQKDPSLATAHALFAVLKAIPLTVGTGLHTLVGFERVALFNHLFPRAWMKRIPSILMKFNYMAIFANISIAITTAVIRVSTDEAGLKYTVSSVASTSSWMYFMWVLIEHAFIDATIIYFVLKTKTDVVETDKAMMHDIKVILGLLCFNVFILLVGPTLAAVNITYYGGNIFRGVGELVYRIYCAGSLFCFQQVKKFSTIRANGGGATIAGSHPLTIQSATNISVQSPGNQQDTFGANRKSRVFANVDQMRNA